MKGDFPLTKNTAMAPPVKNPARTSAQWLRYSATLTTPTSMARQSRVRLMVGLVSRVPLVLNTSVTYICREAKGRARTVRVPQTREATHKHVGVITTSLDRSKAGQSGTQSFYCYLLTGHKLTLRETAYKVNAKMRVDTFFRNLCDLVSTNNGKDASARFQHLQCYISTPFINKLRVGAHTRLLASYS